MHKENNKNAHIQSGQEHEPYCMYKSALSLVTCPKFGDTKKTQTS